MGIVLLLGAVIAGLCVLYGRFVEPKWLTVKTVSLADSPTITLIHISDVHYKGDRKYLSRVVKRINAMEADFVCFTGDLVEDKAYLAECLDTLAGLNKPLFGIPGNHDHWAHVRKEDVADTFAATGGGWLTEGEEFCFADKVFLVGEHRTDLGPDAVGRADDRKRILLHHYPSVVERLPRHAYDLILAGHTHGGQVRIPLVKNPVLRGEDLDYPRGLFHTAAGPLYVNPGIGTFYLPVRFRCRPEITVIRL